MRPAHPSIAPSLQRPCCKLRASWQQIGTASKALCNAPVGAIVLDIGASNEAVRLPRHDDHGTYLAVALHGIKRLHEIGLSLTIKRVLFAVSLIEPNDADIAIDRSRYMFCASV